MFSDGFRKLGARPKVATTLGRWLWVVLAFLHMQSGMVRVFPEVHTFRYLGTLANLKKGHPEVGTQV